MGCHGQGGLHAFIDRVAHDPAREGVLDRAQIELALGRGVLGDVGEPQSVGRLRGELSAHEVIVDGGAGLQAPAAPAGDHRGDPVLAAEAMHTVLTG